MHGHHPHLHHVLSHLSVNYGFGSLDGIPCSSGSFNAAFIEHQMVTEHHYTVWVALRSMAASQSM